MTDDSKKARPAKETKRKYQREDLVWEAVRRNELYREAYSLLLQDESNKNREIAKFERLPWGLGYSLRWKMNGLLDPEISVDEIKEVITSGDRLPGEVHPYYYLYNKKPPVIQFKVEKSIYVPKQIIKGYEFFISDSDPSFFVIPKRFLENKLIIAIDPDAKNKEIINEIKEIKKMAGMQRKEELKKAIDRKLPWEIDYIDIDDDEDNNESENENHTEEENVEHSKIKQKTYYTRDIDDYIGWLNMYDQINDEYKHKNNAEGLINSYGALLLPKNSNIAIYIPTDNTKKYETTVKAYEMNYLKAIVLIQSTPDIKFVPDRVEKDGQKKPRQKKKSRQKKRKQIKVRS